MNNVLSNAQSNEGTRFPVAAVEVGFGYIEWTVPLDNQRQWKKLMEVEHA